MMDEWMRIALAGSHVERQADRDWLLRNEARKGGVYTNAQVDDYQGRNRGDFLWQAPLRLQLRAQFNHAGVGTAGFGFWNDPFMMTGFRMPALPRAIWFFYASPPGRIKLAADSPGTGWMASSIDAIRPPFFLLAPTAPLAIPLMNIDGLYNRLWPIGQRAIAYAEQALSTDLMTEEHTYTLDWGREVARFWVDETCVLEHDQPPRGQLGFVMWIDNQALKLTPWGAFGWQTVDVPREQRLRVRDLRITPMERLPETI